MLSRKLIFHLLHFEGNILGTYFAFCAVVDGIQYKTGLGQNKKESRSNAAKNALDELLLLEELEPKAVEKTGKSCICAHGYGNIHFSTWTALPLKSWEKLCQWTGTQWILLLLLCSKIRSSGEIGRLDFFPRGFFFFKKNVSCISLVLLRHLLFVQKMPQKHQRDAWYKYYLLFSS